MIMDFRCSARAVLRCTRLTVVAFLAACASTPKSASGIEQYPDGVNGITHIEYYEIVGRTAAELSADLRLKGPKDAEGRAFSGLTKSPFTWRYTTRAEGQTCSATSIKVTMYTDVFLPRWIPPDDVVPGLIAQWKQSMTALEVHEAGHKDISARYAKQIRDRINDLRTLCSNFSLEANRISNAIVAEMRSAQIKYDADTRHGLSQGTGFPPPRSRPDSLPARKP